MKKKTESRSKQTPQTKNKDLSPLQKKVNKLEKQIGKLSFELGERKKELKLQNQVTTLLNNSHFKQGTIFQKIVDLLPPAFQFPEKTCARLIIAKQEFTTGAFKTSSATLSRELKSNEKIIGKIEVCYKLEKGARVKNIFLKEEEDLINLISQRIVAYYENKQKEQLLIDKEESSRKLVENLNEIIYEISPAGIINYISPQIKETMGYTPKELIGSNFLSFVHKDDLNRVQEILSKLATRYSQPIEYRLVNKKGETRWVKSSTKPLYEKGKLVGGTGTIFDITENKSIEDNLHESEQLHRSIFEVSPDAIIVTDLEGNIISTSPKALTLFGYKKNDDLVGHSIFEFIHPESYEKAKNQIEKMFKGHLEGSDEYLALKQNGTSFYIEVSKQFIRDKEGKPKQMIFIIRDINERKQLEKKLRSTEELFRTLVESVNEAIYEISKDGTINYVSSAIKKISGYSPKDLIGNNFFEYVHPEDRFTLTTTFRKLSKSNYSYREYRYYTKDGKVRWVASSNTPIIENGKVVGGRGTLIDIHEKKMVELELKKSEIQNREIIESSPVGKVLYDENNIVISVNKKFTEITGYSITDMPTVNKWFETVYPDKLYRQKIIDTWDTQVKNYSNDNSTFISVKGNIKCKDGSYKWIETSYAKIGNLNLVTLIDITARIIYEQKLKQSEKNLRNLVNSQTNYVLKTDLEGKHTYWNRKFEEEFGWLYGEKGLSESNSLDSICEYHHERTYKTVDKCLKAPGKIVKVELDKPKKDGSVRTTLWEFICLTDENDEPIEIQCVGIDITEIREARDKLNESNRKINILMNNLKGVAFRCKIDEHWTMEFMSKGITELTGYDSSDFIENKVRTYDSVIHSEDRDMVWNRINESLRQNKNYTLEYRIVTKDNQVKWVWEKGQGNYDNKKLTAIEGFISDITDRKKAELALRSSEENFKNLFYNSPDGYLLIKDGVFFDCNKASEKIIGGSRSMIIGKTPAMLSPEFQPNGRRSDNYAKELIEEAYKKSSTSFEWTHTKIDGSEFIARVNLSIIDQSGEKVIFVTWQDITDQKAAERELAKFKSISDSANFGIAIADLEGNLAYSNETFANMHGYKVEDIVGKNLSILHSKEQLTNIYKTLELLENKGEFSTKEVWRIKKDGTPFPSLMNAKIISDKKGEPQFMWATAIDISELKESEKALARSESKLNYAQEIAQMGSWDLDLSTNKLTWSKNYYKLLELNEKVEPSSELFNSLIHPDDYPLLEQYHNIIVKTGKPVSFDMRLKMPSGSIKWVRNNIVPQFEDNNIVMLSGVNIDITYRKEIESALLERENQLNHAQEIAKMGSWEYDLENGKVEWSKNYYQLLNHDFKKPPIPLPELKKMVHHDDRHLFEEAIEKIEKSKSIETFQFRIIFEDKSQKWIKTYMHPVFKENLLTSIRGVSIDITDQKESEQEIRKLNMAIEQSPIAIVITDLNATINYVSPAFYEMTGYTLDEVIGKNTNILKSGKTPEATYKDLWNTITKGKTWFGEWVNKKKNGEFYWESVSISPITDRNNKVINYLAIKEDITQKKKIEQEIRELNISLENKVKERTEELAKTTEELETFFTVALDLLCIADSDGNFLKLNAAWENLLGISKNYLEGKKFLDFVHPDDLEQTYKAMHMLDDQNPILSFINRYKNRNGEYRYIEWRSVPVGDKYYSAARDITERKEYEKELNKAREEAETANKSKSEFLSRMSHELRTPMNSILGFAQLMQMGQLNPSQEKGIKNILKSGKHLLGLINEVLDISRIEARRISISMEPVELGGLISEVIDTVHPLASDKNIEIILDESSKGLFVKSDKQKLKQIIINLINNAIKYNHKGGKIWVSLKVMPVGANGIEPVRISIKDNGVGIRSEDIKKLFTPFERIGAEASETEGTGLGLTVVKKLVDLMGGTIGVESQLGEGSNFWLELQKTEKSSTKINNKDSGKYKSESAHNISGVILYVEDNLSNIELVEEILETTRPNIKLITTIYGNEAVSIAESKSPNLILLDLNLPDMHGKSVLKNLKSNSTTKDIPVVVVSADAMPKQIKNLMAEGAEQYITKPLDVQMLLKIVDKFFASK